MSFLLVSSIGGGSVSFLQFVKTKTQHTMNVKNFRIFNDLGV